MQSVQKDIMGVLLRSVLKQGLIAESVYSRAVDLLDSSIDFPECFRYTLQLEKEATTHEYSQNPVGAAERPDDL